MNGLGSTASHSKPSGLVIEDDAKTIGTGIKDSRTLWINCTPVRCGISLSVMSSW